MMEIEEVGVTELWEDSPVPVEVKYEECISTTSNIGLDGDNYQAVIENSLNQLNDNSLTNSNSPTRRNNNTKRTTNSIPIIPKKRAPNNLKAKEKSTGLRHFSMRVCEKVEQKKETTYNAVADDLIQEFQMGEAVDKKNVRRRVYDILNVLCAMDIIKKDKKVITWIGFPKQIPLVNDPQFETKKRDLQESISRKKEQISEITNQQISYENLIDRNKRMNSVEDDHTPSNCLAPHHPSNRIAVPFIVVNTRSHAVINCELANDKTAYFFDFSLPFEIHDDCEIVSRMNLNSHSLDQNT